MKQKVKKNIDSKSSLPDIIEHVECKVFAFLCIHVTTAYRSSPSKVVGAGIYECPCPILSQRGLKPIAVAMMTGVNYRIAERRLVKMLKLMSKYYSEI